MPSAAPPALVLCLPGALLDPTQFAPQRERLAPAIAVVGYDYAAAIVADGCTFTIETAAQLVVQRIEREPDHRRIALCGHSLGGMVALLAARELGERGLGERLTGLMLLETSYGPAAEGWARWLVPPVRTAIAATPWRAIRQAIVREHGRRSVRARDYLRAALPVEPPPGWRGIVDAALRFDGRDALASIQVPTLVAVGERHRWTHTQARTMTQRVPGAELRAVPDAGHMANLDAPDAVSGMMAELAR